MKNSRFIFYASFAAYCKHIACTLNIDETRVITNGFFQESLLVKKQCYSFKKLKLETFSHKSINDFFTAQQLQTKLVKAIIKDEIFREKKHRQNKKCNKL